MPLPSHAGSVAAERQDVVSPTGGNFGLLPPRAADRIGRGGPGGAAAVRMTCAYLSAISRLTSGSSRMAQQAALGVDPLMLRHLPEEPPCVVVSDDARAMVLLAQRILGEPTSAHAQSSLARLQR
eukprot:CAMPEP_0183456562 /NCGR_PEP_ID=MMETSP0370-20130417/129269_1 /TAXON_ID=268820 /ORGANISM="Peridinium aciculiferum, Strain PAER-2" /LENGTH=124 /DNA_ID=CAMNT_0025648219 /DNA_START=356 /DNA_END=729 /DNA_ORIENTATION=+